MKQTKIHMRSIFAHPKTFTFILQYLAICLVTATLAFSQENGATSEKDTGFIVARALYSGRQDTLRTSFLESLSKLDRESRSRLFLKASENVRVIDSGERVDILALDDGDNFADDFWGFVTPGISMRWMNTYLAPQRFRLDQIDFIMRTGDAPAPNNLFIAVFDFDGNALLFDDTVSEEVSPDGKFYSYVLAQPITFETNEFFALQVQAAADKDFPAGYDLDGESGSSFYADGDAELQALPLGAFVLRAVGEFVTPTINRTPSAFTFNAVEGGSNPSDQMLQISNSGGGTLNWSVSDDQSWLSLSPGSGSSTGETDDVSASVDIDGLAAGAHGAAITITDANAGNSPQSVSVTLNIEPRGDDQIPPEITHSSSSAGSSNTPMTIQATLTDNVVIGTATLFYRRGGDNTFVSGDMTNTMNDIWEGTIPANFMTERGLEYYISVKDSAGNESTFPASQPLTNPQAVQITNDNLTFTSADLIYRMVSLPIDLENAAPASVFADDLGNYDNTLWRLSRYSGGSNVEFPGTGNLEPGLGFWLITRGSKTLGTGSGTSVTTAQNFVITLQSGWNQIGNPFAFPVNWNDVVKNGSIQDQLVGYQGSSNTATGYDFTRTRLEPFQGYFVNNLGNTTTIEIPPVSASATTPVAKENARWPVRPSGENDWVLQITAQSGRFLDKDNYIGALHNASDSWDQNDFFEAPFFDRYVSLYFEHHDWEALPGLYTGDFRAPSNDGYYWDFRVRSNITESGIVLTLPDLTSLPEDWQVSLVDKASRVSIDLGDPGTYAFPSSGDLTERDFRIVVGKRDFVEANDLDIAGVPDTYRLSENYPNPFNPETRIDYEVPIQGFVRIAVYNLQGQLIKTLYEGEQNAGRYTAIWGGRAEGDVQVSSGVYLLKMTAENYSAVRKLLLAK